MDTPVDTQVSELRVSNDALGAAQELRRRVDADGYLFFRRLIDPQQIRSLRVAMLKACQSEGWLKAGSNVDDGVADLSRSCMEPQPEYFRVVNQVQKLEALHRLVHDPAILGVIGTLVGETVLPHGSRIPRIMFPQNILHTSPPHQDYIHIQGTPETFTCWMPIGDCPTRLGGLKVLAGSHKAGVYDYHAAGGAGALGVAPEQLRGEWVSADYAMGDAIIFHSMCVHGALPNLTPDRLRFSVDFRYQGVSQPIVASQLNPFGPKLTWEEIYADWTSTDLQYYWKNYDLHFADRDPHYLQIRDAEAFELARQGNEIARAGLLRIINRDADPEKQRAAQEALKELDAKLRSEN
jgi:ectoine hydroxylase-related dioxygenase (phytanoyl-CoA dioxygenase family)